MRGRALDLLNGGALVLALSLASLGSGLLRRQEANAPRQAKALTAELERGPDGKPGVRDARGVLIPLRNYQRIASGTLIADRVLADLCEPERVIAFSRASTQTPNAHRYAGKPTLSTRDDVEQVLALRPDLLIVSELVAPNYIARVEEHGVHVFELGPMKGIASLLPDIRALGSLIGQRERAERYARSLRTRLENIAPNADGPRTLYLSIYGDKLYASGAATSYHDVIEFAGLRDAAAQAGLSGWPELSGEKVLTLDPDVLLTRTGMGAPLCRHPGLERLRACRGQARLVELDGSLLDDPGPAMLEASEALHEALLAPPEAASRPQ